MALPFPKLMMSVGEEREILSPEITQIGRVENSRISDRRHELRRESCEA